MKKETLNKLIQDLSAMSFKDINNQDKDGNTILHYVAQHSDAETIKLLVEKGVNVNARNNKGKTALHLAAYKKRVRNVEVLVEARADVNATDYKNSTALHLAALSGSERVVRVLIKAGSDVNALDMACCSPLFYARFYKRVSRLLEKNGGKRINKLGDNLVELISYGENIHAEIEKSFNQLMEDIRGKDQDGKKKEDLNQEDLNEDDDDNKTYH